MYQSRNSSKRKVIFLGHEFSVEGYQPAADYMPKVDAFVPPTSRKGIQAFLGLVGYYRQHVPRCADIAEPLTRLTRGNAKIAWETEQQQVFDELKRILKERIVLHAGNYDWPFELYINASGVALGACLTQGREHIIDFYSRRLTSTEQRYPAHTLEAFAVCESILHFKRILLGHEFVVYTDHKALEHWLRKDPVNDAHGRMLVKLQDFKFVINYIRGEDNVLADFAS